MVLTQCIDKKSKRAHAVMEQKIIKDNRTMTFSFFRINTLKWGDHNMIRLRLMPKG